jgi:hypothetical protein
MLQVSTSYAGNVAVHNFARHLVLPPYRGSVQCHGTNGPEEMWGNVAVFRVRNVSSDKPEQHGISEGRL